MTELFGVEIQWVLHTISRLCALKLAIRVSPDGWCTFGLSFSVSLSLTENMKATNSSLKFGQLNGYWIFIIDNSHVPPNQQWLTEGHELGLLLG